MPKNARSPKVGGRKTEKSRKPRKTGKKARRAKTPPAVARFPKLKKHDGCGVILAVTERVAKTRDHTERVLQVPLTLGGGRGAAARLPRIPPHTSRALAAVGHPQRLNIMVKLLEGPATYRALQKVTKSKAGPLYHHVSQLRLAGLILPKQRDLYELTRGGRNLILTVAAVGGLIRDGRRRPVAACV